MNEAAQHLDDTARIHLGPALDASGFLGAARAMLEAGHGGEVDASAVSTWDLATFQVLLALRRDVAATGEQVRLVGLRAEHESQLRALGLMDALTNSVSWEVW